MKERTKDISSQQSPKYECTCNYKLKNSLYSHMFIEDFCFSFAIQFSRLNRSDSFYDIKPQEDSLTKYLTNENFNFLQYDLDQILQQNVYSLIMSGKAYIEIVILKDQDNNLKSISFIPLKVLIAKRHSDRTEFIAQLFNGNKIKYNVEKENLIVLDLKDLGFNRKYFVKLINKMAKIDLLDYSIYSQTAKGFDIEKFKRLSEFKLLYLNRKTYWCGRNYANQHMSESYLLYRMAHYKMLRLKFLDYILSKYNTALERFKTEYAFEGRIITTEKRIDYAKCLEDLKEGNLSTSQVSDIINSMK